LFSTLLTTSLSSSRIEIFLDGNIGIEFFVIKLSLFTTIVLLFTANSIINKENGTEYKVKKLNIIAMKIKKNKKIFFITLPSKERSPILNLSSSTSPEAFFTSTIPFEAKSIYSIALYLFCG
jgi:hypothetical protein